jgi:hypothetical protein
VHVITAPDGAAIATSRADISDQVRPPPPNVTHPDHGPPGTIATKRIETAEESTS